MFTGIVETTGIVTSITQNGTNKSFWIKSPISSELKVDQSVSHDGVCLTVEEVENGAHKLTAIAETLVKTNLDSWKTGSEINIERCMQMNGRIDGHIVQGHVDTTAVCTKVEDKNGSWEFSFSIDTAFSHLIIEKGSIAINGTSLTIFNVGKQNFMVAIIPYTYEHTSIKHLKQGDNVNIEFDIIGKYVSRMKQLQ